MSLSGAFQIGRSGLTASQMALQVTGNNLSNAATAGYSRQIVGFAPAFDSRSGNMFLGRGVEVQAIRRQVDSALQQRLWAGVSSEAGAQSAFGTLAGVENLLDALSDNNLGGRLGTFFNSWSELANSPGQAGTRSLVVQQGQQISEYMRSLRSGLTQQRTQIDRDIQANTERANGVLGQIAALNTQIVTAENGQGNANGLRDQRDALITELAQYMDVTTVLQPSGAVDVLVGSSPVVLGGLSRGVTLKQEVVDGLVQVSVATAHGDERLTIRSGRLGALLGQRDTLVNDTIRRLDTMASQLIFQVNRLHSQGRGTAPITQLTGQTAIRTGDEALALNDPANQTFSALPFAAASGSFDVTVRNISTGASRTVRVNVDLNGIDGTNAPGFADDTSAEDIRAGIASVGNVTATFTADGRLSVTAAEGYEIEFSEDTSGALAVLGMNTYFTGTDASNIGVRPELIGNAGLLSSGHTAAGNKVDNGAAMAIAGLRSTRLSGLGSSTLLEHWDQTVQAIAVKTNAAATDAEATRAVRESLDAQRASLSGVNVDEEAINLLTYQRQYQASARYISVVDEMTRTLLELV